MGTLQMEKPQAYCELPRSAPNSAGSLALEGSEAGASGWRFLFCKIQWLVHSPDVAIDLSTLRTGVSGIVAVLIIGF